MPLKSTIKIKERRNIKEKGSEWKTVYNESPKKVALKPI
jgi:hypothetical protein